MEHAKVPLLDLRAHHAPLEKELLAALKAVMDSGVFINGPEVEAFESEVAAYSGAKFGIGVSSGTDALLMALMALEIGPGDEVVTTPYSFFATAGAVARLGAKPVFVDIEPASCNIDPKLIEKALTKNTKCIIPVHLYGQCAEMGPIMDLANRKGIPVLEDAAQAIGAETKEGKRAGSVGWAGCFSFFPTKNLGALGDAGMIVTDDAALAKKLRVLRNHGAEPKYYHSLIGGNFRLDALQAAVLRVKLKKLDAWTKARRENAARYDKLLAKTGIKTPKEIHPVKSGHGHIFNQYVIRAPQRDELRRFLAKEGIAAEIYYPVPLHLQECFKSLGHKPGDFPHSEAAAKETLALPVYPELGAEQQAWVAASVERFYRG